MTETSVLTRNVLNSWWSKPRVKIYYDDTNHIEYVCDANPWTNLSSSSWRVLKLVNDTTWRLLDKYVAWDWEYSQPATDLTTVQALTYS